MSKVKKITAAILALCLVFSCLTATAASKGVVYESKDTNLTATKISHPEAGLGEVDGIVNFESGDADRGQSYSWSAVGYGDYVYIGTCYGAIWRTIQMMAEMNGLDQEMARTAMNALFNGKLYVGDMKNNPEDERRSVIVKINTKTGDADIVAGPFNHGGFRAAIGFNDKIYFCDTVYPPEIIEIDPNNNDKAQIVYKCAPTNKGISVGIRGIAVCNDQLVVSMIGNDGAYIVASKDPSKGQDSFKVIGTQKDLLDYPAYMYNDAIFGGSIFDMASFNGKLYITVVAGKFDKETNSVPKKGFALFEGTEGKDGKWTYKLIVGDPKDGAKYPFGFGGDRSGAANLVVHGDHLYVGGYNDPMIAIPQAFLTGNFEDLYRDFSEPVSLWRMDKAGNWELVAGEANEYFPEVKGNMGAGFDNPMNQYVWRMQSFDGKLFIGTFDITGLVRPIAQFCNGDILKNTPKEWASQIKYIADLVKAMKDFKPEEKSATFALNDAEALLDTMKDMKGLLNKGGLKDIDSIARFHKLLTRAVKLYEKVRVLLPKSAAEKLDKVINQENADKVFYFLEVAKYLSKSQEGFDVLVTEDGLNFKAMTRDGFGDKYNHGVRTFAVNDNGLFLGTANPFYGTQVWHIEEDKDVPVVPETDKDDDTVAPETDAPTTEDPKDEVPDTGVDTTSIAIASSALAAGVVLTLISKKKKVSD